MAIILVQGLRQTQLYLGTTDDAIIAAGAVLAVEGTALDSDGSGHAVHVYGTIVASSAGVYLGPASATASNQYLLVGDEGSISGGLAGAILAGSGRIVNHGSISGMSQAIEVRSPTTGTGVTIFNDGDIDSAGVAILRAGSGTLGAITLTNDGTITSGGIAYQGSSTLAGETGVDIVRNSGVMVGDIVLGGGRDTYDGRGGGVVMGRILGGDGDDRFYASSAAETIDGGAGVDVLDFRSESAVRVSLDGSVVGTGAARNDRYTAVNAVSGSDGGHDYIVGSSGANTLGGFRGNDSLYGGSGDDTLNGGRGEDYFRGGNGNDRFEFYAPTDGGDRIADWGASSGNNDAFIINVSQFGAGLVAGALASSKLFIGTTFYCNGSEDRFILRTTDNTVWFDSNGESAGGRTFLADLQAGVMLTASDFILV